MTNYDKVIQNTPSSKLHITNLLSLTGFSLYSTSFSVFLIDYMFLSTNNKGLKLSQGSNADKGAEVNSQSSNSVEGEELHFQLEISGLTQVDVEEEGARKEISSSASQTEIMPEQTEDEKEKDWKQKLEEERTMRRLVVRELNTTRESLNHARSCTRKVRKQLKEFESKNAELKRKNDEFQSDITIVKGIYQKYFN